MTDTTENLRAVLDTNPTAIPHEGTGVLFVSLGDYEECRAAGRSALAQLEAAERALDVTAFRGYAHDGFCKWVCQACEATLVTTDDEGPEAMGHTADCIVAATLAREEAPHD